MMCANCGQPIELVTITGISVWSHAHQTGGTPYCRDASGRRARPEKEGQ